MTAEQLRQQFDWSHTKPDMIDRVIRAIESQFATIVACCGQVKPNTVITWCDYDQEVPLWAGNFTFRNGLDDVEDCESVLAIRHSLPHFNGQGDHRYENGVCVYCGRKKWTASHCDKTDRKVDITSQRSGMIT